MINETLTDARTRMKGAIAVLEEDLAGIRTGRASTALVEKLEVEYYNTPTPLVQLATISIPEPQLISIRPFDPTSLNEIERAIQASDLGLTPMNDGKIIRLQIPPLTEERRQELGKQVSKRIEEAKIAVRNVRRDALESLRDLEKQVGEDEFHRGKDDLQKLTDEITASIDSVGKNKEKEILEV